MYLYKMAYTCITVGINVHMVYAQIMCMQSYIHVYQFIIHKRKIFLQLEIKLHKSSSVIKE